MRVNLAAAIDIVWSEADGLPVLAGVLFRRAVF